jgi:hypothetical protein
MGRFGGGDALGGAGEVAKVSHRFQPGKNPEFGRRPLFLLACDKPATPAKDFAPIAWDRLVVVGN